MWSSGLSRSKDYRLQYAIELSEFSDEDFMDQISHKDIILMVYNFPSIKYWKPVLNRIGKYLDTFIDKYKIKEPEGILNAISCEDVQKYSILLKFLYQVLVSCRIKDSQFELSDKLLAFYNCSSEKLCLYVMKSLFVLQFRRIRFIKGKSWENWFDRAQVFVKCLSDDYFNKKSSDETFNEISDDIDRLGILHNEIVSEAEFKRNNHGDIEITYFKTSPQTKAVNGKKRKMNTAQEGLVTFKVTKHQIESLSITKLYELAKDEELLPKKFWKNYVALVNKAKFKNDTDMDNIFKQILVTSVGLKSLSLPVLYPKIKSVIELANRSDTRGDLLETCMETLHMVALKRDLRSSFFRAFEGHMNHGILFEMLRKISQSSCNTDSESFGISELSINYDFELYDSQIVFFRILKKLSGQFAHSVTASGVLLRLMEFLKIRSLKLKGVLSSSIGALQSLLLSHKENIDLFIANNGIQLIIDAVHDQLDFMLQNESLFNVKKPNLDGKGFKMQQFEKDNRNRRLFFKDYNTTYIDSLIDLVDHLLRDETVDRLRNLFDSPLLQSFNRILKNSKSFDATTVIATLKCLTQIIHCEPTSYSILKESNTIDALFENFDNFIVEDGECLESLIEIIGAVSLNKEGMEKVVSLKLIDKVFSSFEDVKIIKSVFTESHLDMLCLTCDEFTRHYPDLKPIVMDNILRLVESLPVIVNSNLKGLQFYKGLKGESNLYLDRSEKDDSFDGDTTFNDEDQDAKYLHEFFCSFLSSCLRDLDIGKYVVDAVKERKMEIKRFLPLLSLENDVFSGSHYTNRYCTGMIFESFATLEDETFLSDLFEEVMKYLKDPLVEEFINYEGKSAMMSKFAHGNEEVAASLLQKLNVLNSNLQYLYKLLSEPFFVSSSQKNVLKLFSSPERKDFIFIITKLLKRLVIEGIFIKDALPDYVYSLAPGRYKTKNQVEIYRDHKIAVKFDDKERWKITGPKSKNTIQIRRIFEEIQGEVCSLLKQFGALNDDSPMELGKPLEASPFKQNLLINAKLGEALTNVLLNSSESDFSNRKQWKTYLYIMVRNVLFVLKDSGKKNDNKVLRVLLFMQSDGFVKLLKILDICLSDLKSQDPKQLSTFAKLIGCHQVEDNELDITIGLTSNILSVIGNAADITADARDSNVFFDPPNTWNSSELIGPALVVQALIVNYGALTLIMDSGLLSRENKDFFCKPLNENILHLFSRVFELKKGDSDCFLYPLTVDCPASEDEQWSYLRSLGFPEHLIESFMSILESEDCDLETAIESDAFINDRELLSKIELEKFPGYTKPFEPQFWEIQTLSQFIDHLYESCEALLEFAFKIFELYPERSNEMMKVLEQPLLMFPNSDVDLSPLNFALAKIECSKSLNEANLGIFFKTVAGFLAKGDTSDSEHNEKIGFEKGFQRYLKIFVGRVLTNKDNYSKEWFASALQAYIVALYRDLCPKAEWDYDRFRAEGTILVAVEQNLMNYEVDFETREFVLKKVLEIPEIASAEIGIEVCKYLTIQLQDLHLSKQILQSGVLKKLVHALSKLDVNLQEYDEAIEQYQQSEAYKKERYLKWSKQMAELATFEKLLLALMRRFFESKEFLEQCYEQYLKLYLMKNRNFQIVSFVKKHAGFVLRDPEIFINTFKDRVLIDYPQSYMGDDSQVMRNPGFKEKERLEKVNSKVENTGIMKLLLTELMSGKPEYWATNKDYQKKILKAIEKENRDINEAEEDELANHKEFRYVKFLLRSIGELLSSYKSSKLEFITFSRKSSIAMKPRATALNFLIHSLVPKKDVGEEIENYRRSLVSNMANDVLRALLLSTFVDLNLNIALEKQDCDPKEVPKEDADMQTIRKFTIDTIVKALQETLEDPGTRMQDKFAKISDLLCLISRVCALSESVEAFSCAWYDVMYIGKILFEKNVPTLIASVLSQSDANLTGITEMYKESITVLNELGTIKKTYQKYLESSHDNADDEEEPIDELSTSGEDPNTKRMLQNSTLAMYENSSEEGDEEYDSGEYPDEFDVEFDDDGVDDDSEILDEDDVEEDIEIGNDDSDEDARIVDDFIERYGGDNISDIDSHSHSDSDGYSDSGSSEISDHGHVMEIDIALSSDGENLDEAVASDDSMDLEYYGLESPGFGPRVRGNRNANRADSIDSYSYDHEIAFVRPESQGLNRYRGVIVNEPLSIANFQNFSLNLNNLPRLPDQLRMLPVGYVNGGNMRGSFYNENRSTNFDYDEEDDDEDDDADSDLSSSFDWQVPPEVSNVLRNTIRDKRIPRNFKVFRSMWANWTTTYDHIFPQRLFSLMPLRIVPLVLDNLYDASRAYQDEQTRKEQERSRKREEKKKAEKEARRRRRESQSSVRSGASARNRAGEENENGEVIEEEPEELEPVMVEIGDREVNIAGTGIDLEFLLALPMDMREEIYSQHISQTRALANQSLGSSDIDPEFLNALPHRLREEILEQGASGDFDAESADNESESLYFDNADPGHEGHMEAEDTENNDTEDGKLNENSKKFYTPLLDKSEIPGLVRLLLVPQPQYLGQLSILLEYLCYTKQTRADTIATMLYILQNGLSSDKSLYKTYAKLSKSRKVCIPVGLTREMAAQNLLDMMVWVLKKAPQIRFYMLSEHENLGKTGRSSNKYPINVLFGLLQKPLFQNNSKLLLLLSKVLHLVTGALENLRKSKGKLPKIPSKNLERLAMILISNECSSRTLTYTLSCMKKLSVLDKSKDIFCKILSEFAKSFGKSLVDDLTELEKQIETDTEELSKFTSTGSTQSKLLRVLISLDYLFSEQKSDDSSSAGENLQSLYEGIALGQLWGSLSSCLKRLEGNKQKFHVATVLLPLIESLMVVCKHSKVQKLEAKELLKYNETVPDFAKEPIEKLFFSFTNEHKFILNEMIRTQPKLISGPFAMLVRNPKVLEFDNKRNYFERKLHQKNESSNFSHGTLPVKVSRNRVFLDSYRALAFKDAKQLAQSKLEIKFHGEEGIDAGGVTREWYQVLARQIFNPDYALFVPVASDSSTFHPNRSSWVNSEHLSFFKFIGRIIGKAIYDGQVLDAHFSRAVYKKFLGKTVSMKDMETLDLDYFKSLIWMSENDITDVISETFSVEADDYGEHKVIDLKPNGRDIPVTEENKMEYVRLVVEHRLTESVKDQLNNLMEGFFEIIPKDLVSIFDEQELELLISGLPEIDVDDWKNNTTYVNYTLATPVIQWFWRAVKSFDSEQRAKLLQFVTGTSKVPLEGFSALAGLNGNRKFSIHRDYGPVERLPSAHTCFNQLDLPAYSSYEQLRGSLLLAITEGHEGFGFA